VDPLTQGLLGAAAAQAVLGRRLPRAWLVGAVAGLAPDLDVLIRSASDPLLAIEHHRGFTHSFAFIPFGGAIAALPFLATARGRARARTIVAASVIGYATHGVLDAFTTYGTQLLWPFSSHRVAWSWISIIDPVFTLALLLGVVLAARRGSGRPAAVALAFAVLYLAAGGVQRTRALDAQERIAASRGHVRDRAEAFPTLANLLVWRSLYAAGDSLYVDRIRVGGAGGARWSGGSAITRGGEGILTPEERGDPRVVRDLGRFSWFAGGWITRQDGIVADARYSLRSDAFDPIWGVRFEPGTPHPTRWVNRTRERSLGLGELWREMAGTHPGYRPLPDRSQ
jgi:inner membrane protein